MNLNTRKQVLKQYIDLLLSEISKEGGLYQTLPFPEFKNLQAKRASTERWELMEAYCLNSNNFLDLGCNLGYFCFMAQQCGLYCTGLDHNWKNIELARLLTMKYMVQNISFLYSNISTESIEMLPSFDIINCLAIFHHLVIHYGLKKSEQIMKIISEKTHKYLFFETPNRKEYPELQAFDFMGDDEDAWIKNFLQNLGFKEVKKLADVSAYATGHTRGFYLACK